MRIGSHIPLWKDRSRAQTLPLPSVPASIHPGCPHLAQRRQTSRLPRVRQADACLHAIGRTDPFPMQRLSELQNLPQTRPAGELSPCITTATMYRGEFGSNFPLFSKRTSSGKFVQRFFGSHQHIRCRSHISGHQDRLPHGDLPDVQLVHLQLLAQQRQQCHPEAQSRSRWQVPPPPTVSVVQATISQWGESPGPS